MSTLLRILSRLSLASVFLYGGYAAYSEPGPRTKRLPNIGMPESELAVKVNAATMMVAGALLGLGIKPKIMAAVLLGALLPTTAAGHAFWKETEEAPRKNQQLQFVKNLSTVGGLLLILAEPKKSGKKAE